MNEGQLLGQVFTLPPVLDQRAGGRMAQPNIPQEDPNYFGIPEAQYGLQSTANVADQTSSYYQKLAGLRSFAQGMWKNYGIDVTKPDYSNPDAIAASQAFQMELANAQGLANEAKNSQDLYSKGAALEMENKYRMGQADTVPGQYFDTSVDRGQYSLQVDPTTQQYINTGSKAFDERSKVDQVNQQRQGLIDAGLAEGTLQGNQNALAAGAINPSFNQVTPSAFEYNFGNKQRVGLDEITRIVNHQKGVWTQAKPSSYYDKGKYWLENEDFGGTDIGQIPVLGADGKTKEAKATIDKTVTDPVTGEVRWVFKEDGVPPLRIDNLPTKTIIGYLGGRLNKTAIDEFLAQHPNVLDERKEIIQNEFIAKTPLNVATELKAKEGVKAEEQSKLAEKEVKTLSALRNNGFWNDLWPPNWFIDSSKEYDSPSGKVVIRKTEDDEYNVENIQELIPNQPAVFYRKYNHLKGNQLPTILKDFGVIAPSESNVATPPVVQPIPKASKGNTTKYKRADGSLGDAVYDGQKWNPIN